MAQALKFTNRRINTQATEGTRVPTKETILAIRRTTTTITISTGTIKVNRITASIMVEEMEEATEARASEITTTLTTATVNSTHKMTPTKRRAKANGAECKITGAAATEAITTIIAETITTVEATIRQTLIMVCAI